MSALDPELLEAFVPEFEAAARRLGAAADAAQAARALDALRGMAGALGAASLEAMVEQAGAALDPPDLPALHRAAAALAAHARAIGERGADLPPPSDPPPPGLSAAPEPAPGSSRGSSLGGRPRVLVVDDSAMMRRLVREALEEDGTFEVVGEAGDGHAALRLMREGRPDLTMLDIEMPGLDGFGVLRAWALTGPGAVVVVSSATRPGSAAAAEARRLGAAAILGKPSGAFSPDLRQRQGAAIRRAARRALAEGAA